MNDVAVFLEQQERISCTKMHAVISRAACLEYKRSERYRFYCETCNGGVAMAGIFTCGKCREVGRKNHNRGLCSRCYYQELRAGTLQLWSAGVFSGPAGDDPGTLSIVGDGSSPDVVAEQLEEAIMFDESLPGTPAMAALAKEVEGPFASANPLLVSLSENVVVLDFADDTELFCWLKEKRVLLTRLWNS